MATGKEIRFVVAGEALPAGARRSRQGQVRQAVRLSATGAAGKPVTLVARPGQDVVRLAIANGPTLVLHPEHARDLLSAQRQGGTRAATVEVGAQLAWPGVEAIAARDAPGGWLGQATLESIDVVGDLLPDRAVGLASDAATRWLADRLDAQVNPGVYALDARSFAQSFKEAGQQALASVAPAADGGPMLVLVHGTFVESHSTFGKLWAAHGDQVRQLFDHYANRVYALDHPTLGASPVRNALALVAALPAGARLHLLTHSRGGLVAEVLARACSGPVPTRAELDAAVPEDAADLEQLFAQVRAKGLRVGRMVRVACPARGTLLASRRLDAYLSVLTWALELSGQVALSALGEFLHGIARNRADASLLPGLKCMMPESPFIQWLTTQPGPIAGDLRVVAGDIQGDSMLSWVKTLLADAFYWTDNDLVVHTRAMYGGVPRAAADGSGGARYLLDRGGQVSHFNYFSNARTAEAIVAGLVQGAPPNFEPIGPRSWAGEDASGTRAARAVQRSRGGSGADPASRPAVIVLPGIMGSNIALDGQRVWLGWNFVNGLLQLEWRPETASRFTPDGPIAQVYDELMERLADSHEVIPFAYDWRRPIEDEAQRLAGEVEQALAARDESGQPVRMLAHSMGSLVARTLQLERPEVWQRMMQRDGARLLMLGPPNGGSWAPMETLTGDDDFSNALLAFGTLLQNRAARRVVAGFPGLMQLQAGLADTDLRLQLQSTWEKLARDDLAALQRHNTWHEPDAQEAVYGWSAPAQAVLDRAVALRRRLDEQLPSLQADASRLLIVVGRAPFTPSGYVLTDVGLEYENAPEGGDGRVPLRSAQLPGVAMWQVDVPHGKLPEAEDAFAGYIDLLTQGSTARLAPCEPVADTAPLRTRTGPVTCEAGKALARSRPSRRFQEAAPPASPSDLMDCCTPRAVAPVGEALAVRVLHGDLQFIPEPLLVGHYRSMQLDGSERVVDRLLAGALSRSLAAGLYPEAPGTHQAFTNARHDPANPLQIARPSAAVVVGLGDEGKLDADRLAFTIRQAVLAHAQHLADQGGGAPASFDLASTLIGSGGMRISPGMAAQYVTQGVVDANLKLAAAGWPRVARLTLVELFLERATEAWHALRQQQDAWAGRMQVEGPVDARPGGMRRSEGSYRGASYDFISALMQRNEQGEASIAYELDTRRARTEVRAQHAQTALVRELVASASQQASSDPLIGRTLFNLLVPLEIEPYLAGTGELVLEVDAETAVIPWELLKSNSDVASADARPWSVRCRLVRKLRTDRFREGVMDATPEDAVLVIGEPQVPPEYPPLDGARAEAEAVIRQLGTQLAAEQISALVDHNDARSIINGLFERSYRIVHVAGQGAPGPDGGVVLSGGTFLGAKEVAAMRTVPELVFLNCCHLAGRDVKTFGGDQDRAAFAANVAEKLIEIGVRCVIAAGWAVEDGPAEIFATQFYASLLAGARFIDAVGAAREAAWKANPQGNTWAAYQCYGDPSWAWMRGQPDERAPAGADNEDSGAIASAFGLQLALENLVTQLKYGGRTPEAALDRIRRLESGHAGHWGGQGNVAEAFGLAFAEAGAVEPAIGWLQRAVAAGDGSATLRAAEQLADLQARQADEAGDPQAIHAAIAGLERLAAVGATRERLGLLGSAWKRLALGAWRQGDGTAAAEAARQAAEWYRRAQEHASAAGALDAFDPARAALVCALTADMMEGHSPRMAPGQVEAVQTMMRAAADAQPEFRSLAGMSELRVLEALSGRSLHRDLAGILAEFRALRERVPAPRSWESVHAEARFLLPLYQGLKKLPAAERKAADSLLAELADFSRRTP